jgi:copper homeostasis protein (lipoprotein)
VNNRNLLVIVLMIGLVGGCNSQDQSDETSSVSNTTKSTADDSAGMELEGMFQYMADAAIFQDCRNGKSYPVSMEGQYIVLERAYLDSGIKPGAEIMVNLRGRLLSRPSMEGNTNIISLIVDKLNTIHPDKTCAPTTHSDLTGTYWRLAELDGVTVNTAEGMREAHMVLESEESRVRGFAGCNNFFGQFETEGNALSFSAIGATMMACSDGMDTEQAFQSVLGATTWYQISGLFLELYTGDQLLARLEAVYL